TTTTTTTTTTTLATYVVGFVADDETAVAGDEVAVDLTASGLNGVTSLEFRVTVGDADYTIVDFVSGAMLEGTNVSYTISADGTYVDVLVTGAVNNLTTDLGDIIVEVPENAVNETVDVVISDVVMSDADGSLEDRAEVGTTDGSITVLPAGTANFYSENQSIVLDYDNDFTGEVAVPVYIQNNPGFDYLELDLYVDAEHLEYLSYEIGDLFEGTGVIPSVEYVVLGDAIGESDLYHVMLQVSCDKVITGDGLLLTVNYAAYDGIEDFENWSTTGRLPIEIDVDIFTANDADVPYTVDNSSYVEIAFDVMLGDVNLDQVVDSFDALLLEQYLAGNVDDLLYIQKWAGQVTGDYIGGGEDALNAYDVLHILEYITFQVDGWDKLDTPQ
ncbi:MAG: hypothetical protein IJO29_03735, partial [Oscillospiraceae bacterium]|nr:hypothetical protein [Oscillospiraceae bacterium]